MSFHFPDSSPAPSTPERRPSRNLSSYDSDYYDSDHPSTTPAGPPPPSSAPSFTPAGEPSPSYLQSSIGVMTGKVKPLNFNRPDLGGSSRVTRSSSGRGNKGPLGSSIRGSTSRQPSRLSRQYYAEDEEEEDDDDYNDDDRDDEDDEDDEDDDEDERGSASVEDDSDDEVCASLL